MVYQITGNSTVCLTVCLTNIKENIKACVAGEGNPPVTGGFPSQRASNTDAFSCDETITLTNDEVAFQMNHRWSSRMHYNDVIMGAMASQITNLTIVYSTVYAVADQRKHQRSASLDFVRGIHRGQCIPRTNGQQRGNVSIWWRHHAIVSCHCFRG